MAAECIRRAGDQERDVCMRYGIGVMLIGLFASTASAQSATVRVHVRSDNKAVAGAEVVVDGVTCDRC